MLETIKFALMINEFYANPWVFSIEKLIFHRNERKKRLVR